MIFFVGRKEYTFIFKKPDKNFEQHIDKYIIGGYNFNKRTKQKDENKRYRVFSKVHVQLVLPSLLDIEKQILLGTIMQEIESKCTAYLVRPLPSMVAPKTPNQNCNYVNSACNVTLSNKVIQ
jgi:hypothetical protein